MTDEKKEFIWDYINDLEKFSTSFESCVSEKTLLLINDLVNSLYLDIN